MTNRTRLDRRDDRGTAALELVGMLPVVAVLATLALQFFAVVFVAHATDDAARQAARAQSLGDSPYGAAQDSLPGGVDFTVDRSGETVTVKVKVPRLSPLPQATVTREATMPDTTSFP